MSKPQRISISAAARLLGKSRLTIADKAVGLDSVYGHKGARLFDANELMAAIYGPRYEHDNIVWEETDAVDLAKAMDKEDESEQQRQQPPSTRNA